MRAVMLRTLAVTTMALVIGPAAAYAQQVSIADVSVTEGNVGSTAAIFVVSLDVPAGPGGVTVQYKTQDNNSASANQDYDIKNGTVSFASGEDVKTILVDVRGDTTDEPNETFDVKLSSPTGGATLLDEKGVGTITDDDAAPTPYPAAVIGDVVTTEGHTGITKVTLTISLDRPADREFRYEVSTSNGETVEHRGALPNIDFYSNHEQIVFNTGEQTKTFSVDIIGDKVQELDELIVVRLIPCGYKPGRVADGEAIITIIDDDAPVAAVAGAAAAGRVCLSRRNFTIRLRDHLFAIRNDITTAIVKVDGRRVRVRIGNRLTAYVDLRRKPKKTVNVDIALVLRDGSTIKRQRRYRLCDPRKLDDGIPPAL